jgi:lipid A 3-O-deacylase
MFYLMKKIPLTIFSALIVLLLGSAQSFALDESGCHKLDFLCKLTGAGSTKDKTFNPIKKENKSNIKKIKSTKNTNETEVSVYAGMFDFSDHKQKAGLFGLQHQNDELFRKSFLGKISPITGGFITENSAAYFYTGAQAEYNFGLITITPSFAPGLYNSGDGKDLGHVLEFKSEVQMTLNLSDSTEFGMSYNHLSNASLGTKNPGANSYMVNFLKHF